MNTSLTSVILAAGEAKRMRSNRPKVLHPLCGRPMIDYPLRACRALGGRVVLVVGRAAGEVRAHVGEAADLQYVEQKERLGTGHALQQARGACPEDASIVLVIPGDVPLLTAETLVPLVDGHRQSGASVTMLTAVVDDPAGYGRVVRDGDRPVAIVEHRDATAAQRAIREINTGVFCFDARRLWPALAQITPENDQGEYYLTDVIAVLARGGAPIAAVVMPDPDEALGVNDRKQLAALARLLRVRILDRLMESGVSIVDPAVTYVDDTVEIGLDTVLQPGVVLEGATRIGAECVIGTGSHLVGTRLGDRVLVKPYCVIADSVIEDGAQLGPFCHLRPQNHVGPGAKVGNFAELKKSRIGRGAKVPHMSYVGDTTVGAGTNIGAGTVTCNYDGANKSETVIGEGAFVGTNSSLVAPVTIGDGAYVAAGSVITRNVPPGALAVARGRQETREGWAARRKATAKKTDPTEDKE
ncbi:MAG: bifunctional UDP-N-acetylglucosamine diphosphorylase/glucosamine-1-phosphate N-acetyltransferase GlmU [Candidatus Rokubacteria bacterium]|nr:bifunctional UDP-N-acetylglucosamine diphosphorylase/glucosamine-1-phosphate N-acetyltransferase GlmU [Candidatus Rokubacteria bacterium]